MTVRTQAGLGGLAFLLVAAAGLLVVLVVHAAVPGVATPTLGQAVWTAGWGQSYANQSLLSIYADNFGQPQPAAISFGLPGAYLTGVFIYLGLHPVNAYAAMVACWLTVAFGGAILLAVRLGMRPWAAALAATLWLCLPVVVQHQGYSMLALGIALLPTYLLSAIHLCDAMQRGPTEILLGAVFLFVACTLSVFMDGYTFVMFASAAGLYWLAVMISPAGASRLRSLFVMPIYAAAFGSAYMLYAWLFQGGMADFGGHQLDVLRGWGVDVTFLVQPSWAVTWLGDLARFSVIRIDAEWFGDASVWLASYVLPLLVAALIVVLFARERRAVLIFLLIAAFGLYMSLGPSLKINSQKSPELGSQRSMAAEHAIGPTGSALISGNLPGFRDMRSAYRWVALGALGLWAITIVGIAGGGRRQTFVQIGVLVGLILLVIPQPIAKLRHHEDLRDIFLAMDKETDATFGAAMQPGERVAFMPYTNDFLVNYVAARAKVRAFNTGGDKNLEMAQVHWPEEMAQERWGEIVPDLPERIASLLARDGADLVIVPFIDMLGSANRWPSPPDRRAALEPVVEALQDDPRVVVEVGDLFASIRPSLPR